MKAVLAEDEAHGDAGHGLLEGHAGVHEGQGAAADAAHGGAAVGAEGFRDDADGVGELLLAGEERLKGAAGQGAVAKLAASGGADAADLADGVGREVVVVQVALLFNGA